MIKFSPVFASQPCCSGSRRSLAQMSKVAVVCLALLPTTAGWSGGQAASSPGPENNIRSFYAVLLATMKSGPSLGQRGRYAQLAPVVQQLFDMPYMARLAVGPSWASLSPDQQHQITSAFGHYVAATYSYNFESYSGEQFQVVGEQPFGSKGTVVQTRIVKSDGAPVTINYLMRPDGETWQIVDIYLDGTISQLAVQHSQFASILQSRGASGLILMLDQKVTELTKSSSS
jgi:phospholipid transport system substrate-binding protein